MILEKAVTLFFQASFSLRIRFTLTSINSQMVSMEVIATAMITIHVTQIMESGATLALGLTAPL